MVCTKIIYLGDYVSFFTQKVMLPSRQSPSFFETFSRTNLRNLSFSVELKKPVSWIISWIPRITWLFFLNNRKNQNLFVDRFLEIFEFSQQLSCQIWFQGLKRESRLLKTYIFLWLRRLLRKILWPSKSQGFATGFKNLMAFSTSYPIKYDGFNRARVLQSGTKHFIP